MRRRAHLKQGHVCAGANGRMAQTFGELLPRVGVRAGLEAVVRYPPAVRCDPLSWNEEDACRASASQDLVFFVCVYKPKRSFLSKKKKRRCIETFGTEFVRKMVRCQEKAQ